MADLVELHEHESGDEVHEGGIELEGDVGGADVVAGGHDALHDQGKAHGVVQFRLDGNSKLVGFNLLVFSQSPLEYFRLPHSEVDYHHEQQTERHVADVAERQNQSIRFSAMTLKHK